MLNNRQGEKLFNRAKDSLIYREEKLERAVAGNPALLHPAPVSANRKKFFQFLKTKKYSEAVWETMDLAWPKWQIRAWYLQLRETIGGQWKKIKRGVKSE